jgi:hypothetical protein
MIKYFFSNNIDITMHSIETTFMKLFPKLEQNFWWIGYAALRQKTKTKNASWFEVLRWLKTRKSVICKGFK